MLFLQALLSPKTAVGLGGGLGPHRVWVVGVGHRVARVWVDHLGKGPELHPAGIVGPDHSTLKSVLNEVESLYSDNVVTRS